MQPNDLLGLGKILPIDKLVDILSKAVGKISKPYFDRKEVDRKAYEIRKLAEARAEEMKIISNAVKENFNQTGGIEYKEERLIITSPKNLSQEFQSTSQTLPSLEERTRGRLNYQETKRQLNIESIASFAAEELESQEAVTNEQLDEDWTTRFFRIAEDISNEEMQALWGKILAGEIKQPKSFSLRTLELVRNLTKEEADLYIKAANLAIRSGNSSFIYKGDEEFKRINYVELAQLIEIGLLQPGDFVNYQLLEHSIDSQTVFISGQYIIFAQKRANSPMAQVPVTLFTHPGKELLKLIEPHPSFEYLTAFAKAFKNDNIDLKYGFILGQTGDQVRYTEPLLEFK